MNEELVRRFTPCSVQYASCSSATPHRHGVHQRATLPDFVEATLGFVQDTFLSRRASVLPATNEKDDSVVRRFGKREDSETLPSDPEMSPAAALARSKSEAIGIAGVRSEEPAAEPTGANGSAADGAKTFDAHMYIGPSLAFGFGVMFLIDQVFQTHPHGSGGHTHIVALTDFRGLPQAASARSESPTVGKSIAATIGLVVHAAADGIALGAASASKRASLELLVFVAIMLHKAPSAFGLSSFLLDSGLGRKVVRQHLLAFSFSAPIGALVTYAALASAGGETASFDMNKWTGILLLFSAGTFLFVSTVHILPEVCSRPHSGGHGDIMNGNALDRGPAAKGVKEQQTSRKMTFAQVFVVMCGLVVPYFLSGFHGH